MRLVGDLNVELDVIERGGNVLAVLIFVDELKSICIILFLIQPDHFNTTLIFLKLLFQEGLFKGSELSRLRY